MTIIGVTGTDGKTTTCSLIHFLLQSLAGKTVFIGTTGARIGDEPVAGVQKMTSYDPMALQSVLSKAHLSGAVYGVLEVSSHGLHQHRFDGVSFSVGVLTNISKEHLDYHGTFDNYVRSKQRLFYQVQ
jgi:UDP-N-acetylmuramoyl-L-alanyl-D-glutamate--2,6-diaminopimelate ligase